MLENLEELIYTTKIESEKEISFAMFDTLLSMMIDNDIDHEIFNMLIRSAYEFITLRKGVEIFAWTRFESNSIMIITVEKKEN